MESKRNQHPGHSRHRRLIDVPWATDIDDCLSRQRQNVNFSRCACNVVLSHDLEIRHQNDRRPNAPPPPILATFDE